MFPTIKSQRNAKRQVLYYFNIEIVLALHVLHGLFLLRFSFLFPSVRQCVRMARFSLEGVKIHFLRKIQQIHGLKTKLSSYDIIKVFIYGHNIETHIKSDFHSLKRVLTRKIIKHHRKDPGPQP